MCEYLDYEVETLNRIRIMNIKLDIPVGTHRELTDAEFKEMNALLDHSEKQMMEEKSFLRKRSIL